MATSRVKYQIEVYDITAASGYKSASSAISPVDEDNNAVTLTDEHCSNHFQGNKYPSSMPTGTDALTAEDLSAVFARKTFANVEAAKTAIISSDLATAISTNCSTVSYSLDSNNLIIDCIHADDTKSAAMATAMSVSGWSSEAGAVYSTIS
jgi:hypothetical protein